MVFAIVTCDSTKYAKSKLPTVHLYVMWHKI